MKTFFIAGVQRSGTTLLSVMLSNHPEIDLDGFSTAFRLITCFKNYQEVLPLNLQYEEEEVLAWKIETDYKGRLASLLDYKNIGQYETIQELVKASIQQQLKQSNKSVWGDKAPNLQHYLADISLLLPKTKIIHIVRDGRATAYSHAQRAHKHILLAAQEWVNGNVAALVNQKMVGKSRYLIVKYEDLLTEPEQLARQICTFLDISFDKKMLDMAANQPEKEAERYVKSKFDRSKITQFKTQIPTKTLRKIERIQGPLLKKMGYELMFPEALSAARPLSLTKRMFLNQMDNVRMLFRSKRMGMVNRKNVEVPISFRNRWSKFVMAFGRDFLPHPLFRRLFSEVHNKNKYYSKK